jgi:hypothetical protein
VLSASRSGGSIEAEKIRLSMWITTIDRALAVNVIQMKHEGSMGEIPRSLLDTCQMLPFTCSLFGCVALITLEHGFTFSETS